MRRTNRILCCVAILAMGMIAGPAFGQQRGKGRGGFGGFWGSGLVFLASREPVQKDLGLSADVTSKLTSLRDDYTAASQKEYQNAGVSFQNFQNMSAEERQKMRDKMAEVTRKLEEEFNPKLKALVSADQYKRLQQIQLQSNLRFRGPGGLTYSDVASELKLSDEQKKKMNDLQAAIDAKQREMATGGGFDPAAMARFVDEQNGKAIDALTAEQKEKLAALKGPSFDVTQLGFGGGRRGKGN